MNKYLSIGEVSKLKGVSIKSLRYYEKLGILNPAYINPQTGYRYYTLDQMMIIDFICFCLELDIPLKNFLNYIKEDHILSVEDIIKDAQRIAEEKSENLKRTIHKIKNISALLDYSCSLKAQTGIYKRCLSDRHFLVTPWSGNLLDIRLYTTGITELFLCCERERYNTLYNQGTVKLNNDEGIFNYIFLEIEKPAVLQKNVICIPAGEYQCEIIENEKSIMAEEKYYNNPSAKNYKIVITCELFDNYMNSKPNPIEIQVL